MKMRTLSLVIALVATVGGCATLQTSGPLRIEGLARVTHSLSRASMLYEVGRAHAAQGRHLFATEAFENSLALDADFVEARNALGISHAVRGDLLTAIRELEKAVAAAPDRADILNNLGYAYSLVGRPQDALRQLERAVATDISQPRFAANLRAAQKLVNSAAQSVSIAGAQAGFDLTPFQVERLALPEPSPIDSRTIEPAVVASSEGRASHAPALVPIASGGFEVANGNGATGLAHRVASLLRAHGLDVRRLSNTPKFDQNRTHVQYRPGYEAAASRLQATLTTEPLAIESDKLRKDVNVRLVLGRDVGRDSDAASRLVNANQPVVQTASAAK